MSNLERTLEVFIQALVIYSIGAQLAELELGDDGLYGEFFLWSERIVTAVFTIEYVARWIASGRWSYPLEFMALVDLVAVLPYYLSHFVDLRSLRLVRLLRVLRLFKLTRYNDALQSILSAFHRVRHEFAIIGFGVFLIWWCSAVTIYELERDRQPEAFARLSDALWYVLVTVTTVGYGDKVPLTAGGKIVAGLTMLGGLTLFGTFISLIGSAYLEEIRSTLRGGEEPAEKSGEASSPERGDATDEPAARGPLGEPPFAPREVLAAIEQGSLDSPTAEVHTQAVRLLASACRALLADGQDRTR